MNSRISFFGLVFTVLFSTGIFKPVEAQVVSFNYISGNSLNYSLDVVSKITYTEETLSLHFEDGSVFTWNLNTIIYYNYTQSTDVVEHAVHSVSEIDYLLFPNPSRGEVNLSYTLPHAAHVRVDCYNISGVWIDTLWEGEQLEGEQLLQWQAGNLPSGTYLFKLTTDHFSFAKPVILNR